MASESKGSPTERLLRKRLAARLRQQRCRARKKDMSLKTKQREQQEAKGAAHVPTQARRPVVPVGHAGANMSRAYTQSTHRHQPHKPNESHQPHRPHQPHRAHRPHHPHQILHHLPHYTVHRPVRPVYMTEPPRMHSIGSVVSFDDNLACQRSSSFDSVPPPSYPTASRPELVYTKAPSQQLAVPTVSPTYATKSVVELDKSSHVPSIPQLPTDKKEEMAIEAMLSLGSGTFCA